MKTNLLSAIGIFCLSVNTASAQLDSILYHDAQMESQWGSSTVGDLFGCFVRVTPPSYPATLVGIRGYFRNAAATSTIKWKVFSDPNGSANGGVSTIYVSPTAVPNPAAGGAVDQQYTAYVDLTGNNVTIAAGDLYVGAVQSAGFFGAGIDNAPNGTVAIDRQWQWMYLASQNYWNTLSSQAATGQFGFTAIFSPFAIGINEAVDSRISLFMDQLNDVLFIKMPVADLHAEVKITDLSGRLVATHMISGTETMVDMSGVTPGIYAVVVQSAKTAFTGKIEKF